MMLKGSGVGAHDAYPFKQIPGAGALFIAALVSSSFNPTIVFANVKLGPSARIPPSKFPEMYTGNGGSPVGLGHFSSG